MKAEKTLYCNEIAYNTASFLYGNTISRSGQSKEQERAFLFFDCPAKVAAKFRPARGSDGMERRSIKNNALHLTVRVFSV